MIERCKKIILSNSYFYKSLLSLKHNFRVKKLSRYNTIKNKGRGRVINDLIGKDNYVSIGEQSRLDKLIIRIRGNNNKVSIGNNCYFGKGCSIWVEGNNISIDIGNFSSFTQICHFCAQEDNSIISVGEDCMFSNHIIVRTSDSHPIYDKILGQRLNPPLPVIIGNHVWIAPNTKIMKGAIIPDGCIIGSDSTITKKFIEKDSLIVGRPAKVVKSNIYWTRECLF